LNTKQPVRFQGDPEFVLSTTAKIAATMQWN